MASTITPHLYRAHSMSSSFIVSPPHIRSPRFWLQTVHDLPQADTFVVASYNILSDKLLNENKYLYRNRHQHTLPWSYRAPRLVQAIMENNPDIVCLQEVEQLAFDLYLIPVLQAEGFAGVLETRKVG